MGSKVKVYEGFGELDAHLFARGCHYKLYEVMGGRLCAGGARFVVWAPDAVAVAVVGDFNGWDGSAHAMHPVGESGVWEVFVAGIGAGEKYKFEVQARDGRVFLKADPYAYCSEMRPKTASVLWDIEAFAWQDSPWMEGRRKEGPMNIYEVHLGSYKRADGQFLSYRDLAHDLAEYCVRMGFSHVELLPVTEHPLDESWGYQVSGFYATTSRFGTPSDFQYFVDYMHRSGIGVFLDWVPGHFPRDDFALARFDGSYLYEHADPRQGVHPHWDTHIFNYGRHEVSNFLIGSALFWLDKMHIDGLRVDAVASMLYLDYGRENGDWVANIYGGRENIEAIEFLKHLNSSVHNFFPHVWMCAEESTSFPGVTRDVSNGGLGFDLKWNLGWMHDSLRYSRRDPIFRFHHQEDLTFGLLYAFSEHFILPLSHDEVVHGKGSLIAKMPGDVWSKCAHVRLFYSYMLCYPGKKLLFMGSEIGQWNEWNCGQSLDWHLLEYKEHVGIQRCVCAWNKIYHKYSALWDYDADDRGFAWVDFSDRHNGVIAYLRKGKTGQLLCVHHFTPNCIPEYFIPLGYVTRAHLVGTTDLEEYGGSGSLPDVVCVYGGIQLRLAPLATVVFEVFFD